MKMILRAVSNKVQIKLYAKQINLFLTCIATELHAKRNCCHIKTSSPVTSRTRHARTRGLSYMHRTSGSSYAAIRVLYAPYATVTCSHTP